MNDKNWTPDQKDRPEPWEQGFYETGSTRPPKSYQGVISFLLIALILLGSITSALGLLNIRLFQQIRDQSDSSTTPVRFSQNSHDPSVDPDNLEPTGIRDDMSVSDSAANSALSLGITGYTLSSFDQMIYRLPRGIYITSVGDNSDATAKDILPGDVLLSLDGIRIADTDTLRSLLGKHKAGDTVNLTVYRSGKEYTIRVTVEETKRG